MTFLILLILLTTFIHLYASDADYCSVNMQCNGKQNSGCDCAFGPNCRAPKEHKMSDEVLKSLLVAHNKYREKVASGQETRGGIRGGATEMYALQYDKGLEYTATCWNKKCTFAHDQCRITKTFRPVGQNLYWSKGKACDWNHNLEEATRSWYDEVKLMTGSCIDSYGNGCDTSKIGHFSQMVWAKSTHVGCSLVEYAGPSCQIACNYGPSGNFLRKPVFLLGSPASNCKYKSEVHKHLCLLSENQEAANVPSDIAQSGTAQSDTPEDRHDIPERNSSGHEGTHNNKTIKKKGHSTRSIGQQSEKVLFKVLMICICIPFLSL